MAALVDEMLELTIRAFSAEYSPELPWRILDLERQVDEQTERGRLEHMERARSGECLMMSGVVLLDSLTNYEKMGDHLRNIGRALRDGLLDVGAHLRGVGGGVGAQSGAEGAVAPGK